MREMRDGMSCFELVSDNHARAVFAFAQAFVGFQGHFEGRPTLPAICKVCAVQLVLESARRKPYRLAGLTGAKYLLPVGCNEKIVVNCRWSRDAVGLLRVKATVERDERKVAILDVVFQDAN